MVMPNSKEPGWLIPVLWHIFYNGDYLLLRAVDSGRL